MSRRFDAVPGRPVGDSFAVGCAAALFVAVAAAVTKQNTVACRSLVLKYACISVVEFCV